MDERAREAISDQLLEIAGDEFTLAQVRGELTDTVIAALDAAGYAIVPKSLLVTAAAALVPIPQDDDARGSRAAVRAEDDLPPAKGHDDRGRF